MELPPNGDEGHRICGEVIFNKGLPNEALGAFPNPFARFCTEWERRKLYKDELQLITDKIESLFEPRFITPPETSELIEKLITSSNAHRILEVGMYSGFGTLHMLRAIYGKPNALVTSVDCRPALDRTFFSQPAIAKHFRFVQGWTPGALAQFKGENFDLVFVDSDHTLEHNEAERKALMEITQPGSIWLFHDLPLWQRPDSREETEVRKWINGLVASGFMKGLVFPTPEQLDCVRMWGAGYPRECNPHLGIFQRTK